MILNHVILIYVPKMLDEGTYRYTLILANVYYEGTFFIKTNIKNAQNPHRGLYKNINHGYTFNTCIASDNVVPYHS